MKGLAGLLEGRVAVVTGAGGGLGEGICGALAGAGAAVVAADINLEAARRVSDGLVAAGSRSLAVETDISSEPSVVAMTRRAVEAFGGVDIVVNNAAIYPSRPWTEVEPEEFERVLSVNVGGCFRCARAAYPSMRERGHGRVINISSITFFLGIKNLLAYVSSKGGIVGFTRALARELGPDGITVNCIAPGAFPTEAEKIHPPEEYRRWVFDSQCLQRRGTREDIGNAVVFFASEMASFVTGQTLAVDGGWVME